VRWLGDGEEVERKLTMVDPRWIMTELEATICGGGKFCTFVSGFLGLIEFIFIILL
jgi:hypothetical protein